MTEAEALVKIAAELEGIGSFLGWIAYLLFVLASVATATYIFPHRKRD